MLTTIPTSCAVFMNSGNLKFLEPSGPLQACKGTAYFLSVVEVLHVSATFCAHLQGDCYMKDMLQSYQYQFISIKY